MTDASSERRRDVRTPVNILTGFLGSGKTTLLNRALSDPSMAKTVVIINEFGEVPLDHALSTASSDSIVVLENGCLCCTVFGGLVETMNRLYYLRDQGHIDAFERVLIETSGLADPTSVLQAFLSDPTLEGLYRVGQVICTVDAINGAGTLDEHEESVRQVALADRILFTKLDMLAPDAAEEAQASLQARLRRINPAVRFQRVDDAAGDIVELLADNGVDPWKGGAGLRSWLNAEAYAGCAEHGADCDGAHGHDHHHAHSHEHRHDASVASYCLVRDQPATRDSLTLLLSSIEKNLGPNLLRVKGLINVTEEPGRPVVIQGAQHLLHNAVWLKEWPDEDHRTRIVFITKDMPPAALEEMVTALDRVAGRTAAARERGQQRSTESVTP